MAVYDTRYCGVTTAAKPSHQYRNCALESERRFQPEESARYTVVPFPPVTTRRWPPSYLSGGKLTITGWPRFAESMTRLSDQLLPQVVLKPNCVAVCSIPSGRNNP